MKNKPIAPPLPNNLDAERGVLGAVLLENEYMGTVREMLAAEDFFYSHHRIIVAQMFTMHEVGQVIDLITLPEELQRTSKLEAVGGPAYIASLIDKVPKLSNVRHYASIVREKSLRRQTINVAHAVEEQLLASDESNSAVLDRLAQTISRLRNSSPMDFRDMFHTFDDFEHAASLSFAIKGFLQNNGATLIGGLSGHGKTLVMLSIVKALLTGAGKTLWDLFDVLETAQRVLYLIPESTIEPFKHRLKLFSLYDRLAPSDGRFLVRTLSKGPTPCLSDPRILVAAKGAHVFLDTAVRFSTEGDENSAGDNQRGLAADIFALLGAGARSVVGAHHSPKPFARENAMYLENVLRGSGDIGAMLVTAWGIKQIDKSQNIIHIENIKPRDFQPCTPFQLIGRPFIDETGDFLLHKQPGDCGSLRDEQNPERDTGGARAESRQERRKRVGQVRDWLTEDDTRTVEQLRDRFSEAGIKVSPSAVKNYRREALGADTDTN